MCQSAPFLLLLLGAIASLAGGQLFSMQLFSDRGAFFGRFFVGSAGVPNEGGQPHSVREIVTVSEHPGTFGQTHAWVPRLRGMLVAPVSWPGRPGMLPDRVWEEASVHAYTPQPAVSENTQPLLRSAKLPLSHGEQHARIVALFVVLLLLAGVSGAAVFLALLKCHSSNMGENNLRPFGEALAPVPEEVGTWQQWVDETRLEQPAIKASVVASKDFDKQAVSAYVSGIYDRACGRVEGHASRAYLARLYERAAA